MDEAAGAATRRSAAVPQTADEWRSFFRRYEHVVLVANSDAVDVSALRSRFGESALYVFFNKVFKVLDAPFEGRSLLVARSSPAGANIVYRGEVESVVRLLAPPGFCGILNLRAAQAEVFSRPDEFAGTPAGFLDLAGFFDGFYPATHVPTSGFALAFWLSETCPDACVVLAGFTGRRSRWKLFHDHDWTFEQVVQRLLVGSGRLDLLDDLPPTDLQRIAERLPGFTPTEIALTAAQVLSERLEGANMAIDRLASVTRLQARFHGLLRRLKPKTRKQKLAEKKGS